MLLDHRRCIATSAGLVSDLVYPSPGARYFPAHRTLPNFGLLEQERPRGPGLLFSMGRNRRPTFLRRHRPQFWPTRRLLRRSVPRNRPNRSWLSSGVERRRGNLGGSSSLFGFRVKSGQRTCALCPGQWCVDDEFALCVPLSGSVVSEHHPIVPQYVMLRTFSSGKPSIPACG